MSEEQPSKSGLDRERFNRRQFMQCTAGTSLLGTDLSATSSETDFESLSAKLEQMDGDGSDSSPYVVTSAVELQAMEAEPAAAYKLGDEIDATETATWNDGAGFAPLETFSGTLDGNGSSIAGLVIDRPDERRVGLFGELRGTVRNLTIRNSEIRGNSETGLLAGRLLAGTVENIEGAGQVEGEGNTGGLTGSADVSTSDGQGTTIKDCTADCQVTGKYHVGGIAGSVTGGGEAPLTISGCVSNGPITGADTVGGIVGRTEDILDTQGVRVIDCAAHGSISAAERPETRFGGLIGGAMNTLVNACKATGGVNAATANQVGGLVGEARDPNTVVKRSRATGTVSGEKRVGGLVGYSAHSNVKSSTATGDVTGTADVGGALGELVNTDVRNIYAAGAVSGERRVGGLLGTDSDRYDPNQVTRTVATGSVTGESAVGAITGKHTRGEITDSYWDVEATGQQSSPALPDANGVSTAELTGDAAATTLSAFDFVEDWKTREDDYPTIRIARSGQAGRARIETVRLVQTTEHSRVLSPDAAGASHLDSAPVSVDCIREGLADDIVWMASKPDVAAKRMVAPVFDIHVENPDRISNPVTLTGRLYRNDDLFREWTTTLAPEAVAGNDRARQGKLRAIWDRHPSEQLSFLETLPGNFDVIDGQYPIFPAGAGSTLELAIDSPDIATSTLVREPIDGNRVRSVPSFTVGIVGLEGTRVDSNFEFSFDDGIDLEAYADALAETLIALFPIRSVTTAVRTEPHSDYDGFSDPHSTAIRAADVMQESLENSSVVTHTVDSKREVSTESVDMTIGVVPEGFFDGNIGGITPVVGNRPLAKAVVVEPDGGMAAAHELGHYFLGNHFENQQIALGGKDAFHATERLTTTGYALQDGEFDIKSGRTSLMSYNTDQWMDAHTYQGLIDSRFRPFEEPLRHVANQSLGDLLQSVREQHRILQTLPQETVERLTADVDGVTSQLDSQIRDLSASVQSTGSRWDIPDLPEPEFWNRLSGAATMAEKIGRELRTGPVEFFDERGTRSDTVGEQLEAGSNALKERSQQLAQHTADGINFALHIDGHVRDSELDLTTDLLPTLAPADPVDGDGRIDVFDSDGNVLTSAAAVTNIKALGNTSDSRTVDDAVVGSVTVPPDAATVELAIRDANDRTTHRTINPVADPIRDRIASLPDGAFTDTTGRQELLGLLDELSTAVEAGNTRTAQQTLQQLRTNFLTALQSDQDSTTRSQDHLLSMIDTHETRLQAGLDETPSSGDGDQSRFGTNVTDSALPLGLGGLMCGGAGLYLFRRHWGDDDNAP